MKLKESTIINYLARSLPGIAIALILFPLLVSAPLSSAPGQSQTLLLKNARIQTMGGPGVIENGMILVESGKIKKIGRDISVPPGAEVLDLSGKTVIPGLVCAAPSLFLYERDLAYAGEEGADTDILEGINYDDPSVPEVLQCGVTTAYISPVSFRSTGALGAVVKLKAGGQGRLTVLKDKAGLSYRLDRMEDRRSSNLLRLTQYHRIRDQFRQAQEYSAEWRAYEKKLKEYEEKNKEFEKKSKDEKAKKAAAAPAPPATPKKPEKPRKDETREILVQALDKKIPVRFEAHRPDAILQALKLAEEFGLLVILEKSEDWASVLPEIERTSTPLLLNPLLDYRKFTIPGGEKGYAASLLKIRANDLFYSDAESLSEDGRRWENWKRLASSKARFALIPPDSFPLSARFMKDYASLAVGLGISAEAALSSVTSGAARILGVFDRVGSLEEGKDADLVVLDGDPLDSLARIQTVYVDGSIAWKKAP